MKKLSLSSIAEQILGPDKVDRAKAAKLYFSGELDILRADAVKNGAPPWRILAYRRTIDPEKLPYPLSKFHYVRPATFEQHLKYLAKNCKVVPLDTLTTAIATGENIPEKTVAITIDGGWLDNFVYAFPLLLKYQLPATVFLPTAFVNTFNYFWQDKILLALMFMMNAGVDFHPFDFFTAVERDYVKKFSPDGKITLPLIFIVTVILAHHNAEDRTLALRVLSEVARQKGGSLPPEPAFMGWEDIKIMDDTGITFGSMSHTHAPYPELSAEKIKDDLRLSYQCLQENVKNVASTFCLPDGVFDGPCLEALAEYGIDRAVSMADIVYRHAPDGKPVAIPRAPLYEGESYCTELFACRLWLGDEFLETAYD
jgi:peptidoglycan/xylan/chitin deacetylase (PgdA/CDA1 family)